VHLVGFYYKNGIPHYLLAATNYSSKLLGTTLQGAE
jgi:hypothetical protein